MEKDLNKAIYWYNKAAENGNELAKYNLDRLYEFGMGINKNKNKAFELYQKSAESDNKIALYKLGELYELGNGINKVALMAFQFYKKSAERGYIDGKYKLGYCYDHGIGTDIDKKKAVAAEGGNNDAQKSLVLLYEYGKDTQRNTDIANYWYKKVIKNGFQVVKENLEKLLTKY